MSEKTPAGGAILSAAAVAEWLAEVASRHYEFEAKYCDDDGNIVLRERRCAHCDEDWPCDVGVLLAQDGRWRALVGELLEAAADEPLTIRWRDGREYAKIAPRLQAALQAAQAALAGVPPASRGAAE